MDISEIREKAKKLKKEAPGKREEKPEAKAAPAEKAQKKRPGKKRSEERKKDDAVIQEPLSLVPEEELGTSAPAVEGQDAALEELEMPLDGEEGLDFLTLAMNALYNEGYTAAEEVKEEEVVELLCFMLSDEEYAVNISDLREIIKVVDVTDVPKTPDFVLGIISLRGTIIPLFDLRLRLGFEAGQYDRNTRIIIVSDKGRRMGLLVDRVTEVVRLKRSALEPSPALLSSVDADLLKGVGRYMERLLIMPNLSRIFDYN